MASELIDKLRSHSKWWPWDAKNPDPVLTGAVAEIERLTAENARLKAIVEPMDELCNDRQVVIHRLFSGAYNVRFQDVSYREPTLAEALEAARKATK